MLKLIVQFSEANRHWLGSAGKRNGLSVWAAACDSGTSALCTATPLLAHRGNVGAQQSRNYRGSRLRKQHPPSAASDTAPARVTPWQPCSLWCWTLGWVFILSCRSEELSRTVEKEKLLLSQWKGRLFLLLWNNGEWQPTSRCITATYCVGVWTESSVHHKNNN